MHGRLVPLLILAWLMTAAAVHAQEDDDPDEEAAVEGAEALVEPTVDEADEEDCAAPCLTYGLSLKLESEAVISARPSSDTGVDTGISADLELNLAATENLGFVGVISGETVTDWEPGQNRALRDLGDVEPEEIPPQRDGGDVDDGRAGLLEERRD